jgi:hypothetical protein
MLFIGKSYFDGVFQEIGKDHYNKLKGALSSLTRKTMSTPRIEPIIIASKEGKIRKDNPYSHALSIYAEANDGNRFKLLLPKATRDTDYHEIICKFLQFLENFHHGIKVLGDIGLTEDPKRLGGTILLHLNHETKTIEWLDHRK